MQVNWWNLSVILPPSKKIIIYEDTNILVSGAFLKCFSIFLPYNPLSFSVSILIFLIRHFLVILTLSDYSGTLCTALDQPYTCGGWTGVYSIPVPRPSYPAPRPLYPRFPPLLLAPRPLYPRFPPPLPPLPTPSTPVPYPAPRPSTPASRPLYLEPRPPCPPALFLLHTWR